MSEQSALGTKKIFFFLSLHLESLFSQLSALSLWMHFYGFFAWNFCYVFAWLACRNESKQFAWTFECFSGIFCHSACSSFIQISSECSFCSSLNVFLLLCLNFVSLLSRLTFSKETFFSLRLNESFEPSSTKISLTSFLLFSLAKKQKPSTKPGNAQSVAESLWWKYGHQLPGE